MAVCLERFAPPTEEVPVYSCDQCEAGIYAGMDVVVYEDYIFCDSQCLDDYVSDHSRVTTIEDALGR
jgi:hypothetical protein